MSKLKGGLILLVIFIVSISSSFYFEESYRKFIRRLYVSLSQGEISFFIPKKYLHFASVEFVLSFGIFVIALCFLLYRQTKKQRVVNNALGLFFLAASILIQIYFDVFFKTAECTVCINGKMQLYYNDINYDFVFISSLIFGIIPFVLTEIRKLISLKGQKG